jgi:TatD DNase family protein
LNFDSFDSDREAVIRRAVDQGVQRIVIPGVDLATSRSALALAQAYPGLIYAAVGSHPNETEPWEGQSLVELRQIVSAPWVVAIGEIGLDFYRDHVPPLQQVAKFKDQLQLAADLNLPVILHNRNSMDDLLPILTGWYNGLLKRSPGLALHPGILHSFDGSETEAKKLIEMNFLIGIGGPVTFKNALEKQALVASLPLGSLVTETDAPYLTPHPHRGKRNEPMFIALIMEKIALLQHQSLPSAAEQIMQNAGKVFSWGDL